MKNELTLIDNEDAKSYQFIIGDFQPKIEYIKTKEKIYLTHTEVPVELEGKGIGSHLVKLTLEDVEKKHLKLIPLCPFVAAYIKRHPEWNRLLETGFNIK